MAEKLAVLTAEIRADDSPLRRTLAGLSGKLSGQIAGISGQMGKALSAGLAMSFKAGIAGIAGGGIGALLTGRMASDADEIQSKFDVVFRSTSAQAEEFAKTFARSVGRSVVDTKKTLSEFGDLFKPLGFAEKDALKLSEQLVKLGVDLASFNNMSDDEAMQRLTSGILGETEPLKRFGIVINQARLDAELLRLGYLSSAKGATEVQKAQARLNLIMGATTDAQGDAIRTADGFANSWKGLQGQTKDLAVAIGQAFLPAMTQAVSLLRGVADVLSSNSAKFAEWGSTIGDIAGNITSNISAIASSIANMLGVTDMNFSDSVGGWLDLLAAFTADFSKSWKLAYIYAARGLTKIFDKFATIWDGVKKITLGTFEGIIAATKALAANFGGILSAMGEIAIANAKLIAQQVKGVFIDNTAGIQAAAAESAQAHAKMNQATAPAGQAFADAWSKRVATIRDEESESQRTLRAEIERLAGEIAASRADVKARKLLTGAPAPAAAPAVAAAAAVAAPAVAAVTKENRKASFIGLADYAKQMQSSLSGGRPPEKKTADNTAILVTQGREQKKRDDSLISAVKDLWTKRAVAT